MDSLIRKIERGSKLTYTESENVLDYLPSFQQWLLKRNRFLMKYCPRNLSDNLIEIAKVIESEQNMQLEIDVVYDTIGACLRQPSAEYSYCLYSLDEKQHIALRESNRELKYGTTGLFSWPAADAVVRNMNKLRWPVLFQGKKVVEIGSGVGFLGIACLALCHPKMYLFTDHSEEVLNILHENVKTNTTDPDLVYQLHGKTNYEIRLLDFCTDCSDDLDADFLLASDIVFDPSMMPRLSKFISAFLCKQKNRKAFIACTIRSEQTYAIFIESLTFEKLSFTIDDLFCETVNENVKLLTIVFN